MRHDLTEKIENAETVQIYEQAVHEMAELLELKKTDSYWLIHKWA